MNEKNNAQSRLPFEKFHILPPIWKPMRLQKLIIGSDEPEIASSFSQYKKEHVMMKYEHLVVALRCLVNAVYTETPMR